MVLSFLGEVHFSDEHRQQSVGVELLFGLLVVFGLGGLPVGVGIGGLQVGIVGRLGREVDCRFSQRFSLFDRRESGPQQRLAAAGSNHF